MNKGKLTFVDMLDLEAREEGSSGGDWRSGDSDSTEVDSDGNLRDLVCKDDDAEEPLLTPGSRTSTSSDGSYRDEQARIDGHGPRGLDDYVRSLKSFRNEMELCEGAVQDRAADADTAGSARCHETGERGRSPPGADTKREGEAAEDSDSEPPFLRSRHLFDHHYSISDMDRIDRAAVYGYRARLPRHRLGLRSRVLVDLTCRHSSQSTEIIDLTGDETGYRQPQQASHLDAVVKMASDIDTSATNEAPANPVGLYCAACNGTIGAQPVLRICGCLYCKACNANAARRWNGQDFACNIYQHWRQGNHAGRETFGLDEECSICFETLATGQIQCLPCEQHPETVFTRRDIYNARASINCDKLGGYTPTAALIKLFDENKIPYLVKWADNNSNRLVGLVWTFPYCLQMWKRFPEVISFDNTYNTNRFKLPLFQATGQTCLGSVYNAAFGLIDNEKREGFQFLSESIRQLAEQHLVRQPGVIITDFDDAMKAALNDQFPEAQQQLCIHHIISNVLLKAKQKWVTDREPDSSGSSVDDCDGESASVQTHSKLSPKDRRFIHQPVAEDIPHSYHGVLMMWKHVMFAETEEAHEKAWCDLCREFDDQRAILRYLHGTYMPVRAQWARCFIRKYRNFGIRVTSGTEASNNNVKSYLLNGMSNLHRLVEAIQDMIRDQERDFAHASAEDEVLTARGHIGSSSEYLGNIG
ncbi:mutator-like element [Purpureocillium lavendulum]|uniref:Mutator-like element n=1 Tax=Purpureocillium lavendulum TaxID=1247861 RepID=A0AB34FDS0_9HYPO|nr:mutator-like element [Purpureocillium lavendulum]